MELWLEVNLTKCLGFPVPEDMVKYVMTLSTKHEIDNYFGSLLDISVPEHRNFLEEYKKRILPNTEKNNSNKGGKINKKNPNQLVPKPKTKQKDNNKEKSSPSGESATASKLPNASNQENVVPSTGAKKKTKYVNLYSQDGAMNDVIMLKGRRLCNCEASKHNLINNCMQCGRIVCEQEGSGPCLFCGNLVCTEDELRVIESSSKKGTNLKKSLLDQERPEGWEEALAMRNRLLDYDRTSEKRTTVIDDESDYFRTNSVWLSDEERAKLKKIEEKMNEKKFTKKSAQKITIDFTGRQIVEEPLISTEFEDDVLREIASTFSNSNNPNDGHHTTHSEDCDPNADDFRPTFDVSVVTQGNVDMSGRKFDGVYNRVQDKELLEISDLKKCMSMHQPWASLLIAGIKLHEGRSWYTSHRGRLWIASTAKPVDPEEIKLYENFYKKHYNDDSIEFPKQYPSGCLLGCVLVQDCLPQEEYRSVHPNGESESPYVFICSNPQELPVKFPIKGAHKIYKLEDGIHIAAVKALQRLAKLQAEEK